MFLNPFTGKLVIFLTCGIALKISNYSANTKVPCRGIPPVRLYRGCRGISIPLYVSLSLSVSSMPNAMATVRCLSLALWRVSIGRDRRNLISMKRALGDFIRATSYPTFSLAALGEMFPRSIISQTSPEFLRRLLGWSTKSPHNPPLFRYYHKVQKRRGYIYIFNLIYFDENIKSLMNFW